jgi:hypothetical protein
VYVGLCCDPKVDFDKIGKDLYDAGYTQVVVFGSTGFNNNNVWPWPFKNNRFDYTKINPVYAAQLSKLFERMAFYRIRVHFKFVDQFHGSDDVPIPDPFRQAFDDFNDEALYSSYVAATQKKYWLDWDEVTGGHYSNYRCIAPVCGGIDRYINAVIAADKAAKLKWPDRPAPSWVWANETMAYVDVQTGHVVNVRSRGDRDEVFQWVRAHFSAAGYVDGKDAFSYIDYVALLGGRKDIAYSVLHDAFTRGIRGKEKSRLEIHGMLSESQIRDVNTKAGLDPRYVLYSTDGDLRLTGDYAGLAKQTSFDIDLKLDCKPGLNCQFWNKTDMMYNFQRFFHGPTGYDHIAKGER